jgi:hypothetical protein
MTPARKPQRGWANADTGELACCVRCTRWLDERRERARFFGVTPRPLGGPAPRAEGGAR